MRPRTVDYSRFRELYDAGCNDREIARQCGCSRGTVFNWRKMSELATHLPMRRRGLKTDVEKLLAKELNSYEIARRLGCHPSYVRTVKARQINPGRDAAYSKKYLEQHNALIGRS